MRRVKRFLLSIKQTLVISHLALVLLLISSLSLARYNSEWKIHLDITAERAEEFLLHKITDLSTLVAGRNYSNLTLPSQLDEYYSHKKLLFLDIKGTSDYQNQPVHVRYHRLNKVIWREDVSNSEIESLREKRDKLEKLISQANKDDFSRITKLKYVLQKATDDYAGAVTSMEAKQKFFQEWLEPQLHNELYFFDKDMLQVHVIIPLRNEHGGRVWAIFDVSELKRVQEQILYDIIFEAGISALASLLLILVATNRLIQPLSRLSLQMKKDVEEIDITDIDERLRKDELGELANSFILLITKIRSQMRVLKDRTYLDSLTGLGSRYKYSRHADSFLLNSIKLNQGFSLTVCDIDNFKAYNDSYGHAEGDKAIKSVAKAIIRSTNTGDECYRIGGEEFVILTKDVSSNKAEMVRKAVEALNLEHMGNGESPVVTISCGTCFLEPGDFYKKNIVISRLYYELFNKADQQLYLAKTQGRNCSLSIGFDTELSQSIDSLS